MQQLGLVEEETEDLALTTVEPCIFGGGEVAEGLGLAQFSADGRFEGSLLIHLGRGRRVDGLKAWVVASGW